MAASPLRLALRIVAIAAIAGFVRDAHPAGGVVVIGHPSLLGLDATTLERIYTGRVIEINGMPVVAVNANAGSSLRNRFLQSFLNEDEDKYTAYWVVRRYIGKGVPPREVGNSAAVINFVRSTPGAIGYVDETELQPGVTVLLR